MKTNRRRAPLFNALLIVLALTVTGTAFAYWARGGNGSGGAATGTAQALELTPGTPGSSGQLYPGGQTSVAVSVKSVNPGIVHIGSLTLDTAQGTGGFAVDAGHTTCDLASLSFTTQTNGGAGYDIPNGTWLYSVANALSMGQGASNTCQGATFTVYLKVGP